MNLKYKDWRISVKIAASLVVVLAVILGIFTFLLVQQRSDVLREELLVKARTMALVGAEMMQGILTEALENGQFSREELFDTDYQQITDGPLAGTALPKYTTAYDHYLDRRILAIEDRFLEDSMVVFAALVDKNGYLPVHNSRFSQPLTGNEARDQIGNRTKRLFNDEVGLGAARYDGRDGQKVLRQVYKRDTGETMWDVSAPIYVDGQHWGGFRIGFSMEEVEAAISELRNTVALSMLGALLIASIILYLVVARITRPLTEVTAVAERIAEGNLDQTIAYDSKDEIGQLAQAFNKMTQVIVRNLRGEVEKSNRLIANVKEAIQQLSTSANEIMAISAQQASGATEQASAVQQATTTSEEIAVTARQVAENALRVEALAEQSNIASSGGMAEVENANQGMGRLKGQVQSIAVAMLKLGEDSQKIGGIIDIIDEISDQTNLLALNAAIEAAGAGEAGKRFSIVASEVKRLAQRTVDATAQIKALIEQIQKATNSTIMLTEEGTKGVDSAGVLVARVGEVLSGVLATVRETTEAAREIKFSTQQQTTASEQMAETVAEVRDVASQVAASAEETTQAIADLTTLAERLRDLMAEETQNKGRDLAQSGARAMERVLAEAIASGRFTMEQLFDENYQPIPNTFPQKYRTCYDSYLDEKIVNFQDRFLNDPEVIFAALVDRNGYLPTHNTRFTQPMSGNRDADRQGNRTKRLFNDAVGLAAARNQQDVLVQQYTRDTGEQMADISAPVSVQGRHWGAFRIGFNTGKSLLKGSSQREKQLA